jgi:uncharacterized SAM-binding protein YcdF (DUF218 family)
VIRRIVSIFAAVTVLLLAVIGVSGHFLFTNAPDDKLRTADAVVVLGGEHDGREAYGVDVAAQVGAKTVLLSDPYSPDDAVMRPLCNARINDIDVICQRPVPMTTRGEAAMAREQAREHGWTRIVVVTWRFHILRARSIFSTCYSDAPGQLIMRAVPKNEDFPFAIWEFIYVYQYLGLAKALMQGSCTG